MADNVNLVVAAAVGNGKVYAVKVQDLANPSVWYTWQGGGWDVAPKITPGGGNLYVAAYFVNQGNAAVNFTINIRQTETNAYYRGSGVVAPGSGNGLEAWFDMPANGTTIEITVNP